MANGVLAALPLHVAVPVALHWHHWTFEPPLCRALTELVVRHALA